MLPLLSGSCRSRLDSTSCFTLWPVSNGLWLYSEGHEEKEHCGWVRRSSSEWIMASEASKDHEFDICWAGLVDISKLPDAVFTSDSLENCHTCLTLLNLLPAQLHSGGSRRGSMGSTEPLFWRAAFKNYAQTYYRRIGSLTTGRSI